MINKINNLIIENKIKQTKQYLNKLMGIKYSFWFENETTIGNNGPFWASSESMPIIENIKKQGINCAGLINLVRRNINLSIPLLNENYKYAGGTYAYFKYFKSNLIKFDLNKSYNFCLLIKNYVNPTDQGHIAIIDKNYIIHATTYTPYNLNLKNKLLDPGVTKQTIDIVHQDFNLNQNFYICQPEVWLNK